VWKISSYLSEKRRPETETAGHGYKLSSPESPHLCKGQPRSVVPRAIQVFAGCRSADCRGFILQRTLPMQARADCKKCAGTHPSIALCRRILWSCAIMRTISMNLRGKENDSSPGSQDCDLVLCGIGGDLYEVKQTGHISCSLLSTYPRAYDYDPLHERMFRCWMSTSSRSAGGLTKNGHAELSTPGTSISSAPFLSIQTQKEARPGT
jgi:hypothetical protein